MAKSNREPPLPGARREVSLADVIRVFGTLGPKVDRRAIVECLGFEVEAHDDGGSRRRSKRRGKRRDVDEDSELMPEKSEPRPSDNTDEAPDLDLLTPIGTLLGRSDDRGTITPLAAERAEHHHRPSSHEPLYRPNWTSSIVLAAVQTAAPGTVIDVDELVRLAANARPILELPMLPWPSSYRGVQLLVDIGEGMEPYHRDQGELASTVADVVGAERVQRRNFRYCPTRSEGCGSGPIWTWQPYELPDPGQPALVLSDFGIGRPGAATADIDADEWLELARRFRRQGSQLVAFVPQPADRWPSELAAAMSMFVWDRATSPAAIRQTLGRIRR